MSMDEMCKKAYDLLATDDFFGIYLIKDIGNLLVFYGGNPDEVYYGVRTVYVNKETGETDWFLAYLYNEELKQGKKIEVPSKYKFKAS